MAKSKFRNFLRRWRRGSATDGVTSKIRALVVEPDEVTQRLLVGVLKSEGLAVRTARSELDALAQLRHEPADLVFLDAELASSALSVLAEIRRWLKHEEVTVIVALGRDQAAEELAVIAAGADDCMVKPLTLSAFRARVQARLRGRKPSDRRIGEESQVVGPGTILEGKYRLGEPIGSGNYGTVYRARHMALEREVAIKILHPRFSQQDDLQKILQQEGASTCRIEHPNAVTVLDLCLMNQGGPFLVMELLKGRTLADEIATVGQFSPVRCAEVLLPVCQVLQQVHALNMVHQDIKPANIFLHEGSAGEVVKVLDFGIVRMLSRSDVNGHNADRLSTGRQIRTDTFAGSPAYASPERLFADPYNEKADIYSLGVILYEMLVGRRPFDEAKNAVQLMILVGKGRVQPLREIDEAIPADVERLVTRALHADPAERPSAAKLAEALEGMLS